ncbi:serine hydrolase domain-containing protein [Krasilnikoviella flava]|uniref:CubicO group peptidase, beta-lactamase class C family n=1 Tax=Krasilnikoviella flava TaxID=526729 RepID=A0A1T5IHV1_9MICO|nr:serine hydrolase domain-containing protein [Krasilnikoviella flava]SKC38747.1 CubicO group peptidase, beta-lactamase class C family [Krasilnikoviella flava]
MTSPHTVRDLLDVDHLAAWVATQAGFARVPGVQYAVRVADDLVLEGAWGVADITTGEPLGTDHVFRVASHSKTFTATAVARLADRGELRLDDPFEIHLAELAGTVVGRVTLREALGHTGGVRRDGTDADFWQLGGPFPGRDALVKAVTTDGLVLGRGEVFKYSNLAYGLLGLVVEAVTGVPFAQHVLSDLLGPLGLERTAPELDDGGGGARAVVGHSALGVADDGRLPVAPVRTGALAAATGFCSTASDLTRWFAAHADGSDLLRPETRRLLQRDESVIDRPHARVRRYGLGFETREIEGRRVVGHGGAFPGQLSRTWADPAGRVVVSVLTNAIDGPADTIATGLFALVATALDAGAPTPEEAAALDRRTGRFASLWGLTDVVRLGSRLWLIDPRREDPLAGAACLDVDGDVLRLPVHDGFGAPGEPVEVLTGDDGRPAAIVVGGLTSWRAEDYERERRAQLAALRARGTSV